jgi:hypothetical protein
MHGDLSAFSGSAVAELRALVDNFDTFTLPATAPGVDGVRVPAALAAEASMGPGARPDTLGTRVSPAEAWKGLAATAAAYFVRLRVSGARGDWAPYDRDQKYHIHSHR